MADLNIQSQPLVASAQYTYTESPNTDLVRDVIRAPGSFFLNAQYSNVDRPLVERLGGRTWPLIDNLQSLELRTGVLVHPAILLSVYSSVNEVVINNDTRLPVIGDTILQMKHRLNSSRATTRWAFIPELSIPTGSKRYYLSNGSIGGSLKFAAERTFSFGKLAANFGFRHFPGHDIQGSDYRNQLILALGSYIPVTQNFAMNVEFAGFPSVPYKTESSPGEFYVGGMWGFCESTTFSAGISTSGFGQTDTRNSSVRAIAGFKYKSNYKEPVRVPAQEPPEKKIVLTYRSRPLTNKENVQVEGKLPYNPDVKVWSHHRDVQVQPFSLGESTGMTKNGVPYVTDKQIVFAIDLSSFPTSKDVKAIKRASLKMTVNKISDQRKMGTEVLCFINEKVCSGEFIGLAHWKAAFNHDYYGDVTQINNDFFSRIVLDKQMDHSSEGDLYSKNLDIDLEKLIGNSNFKLSDLMKKRSLYIAVADDTFIYGDVSLELELAVRGSLLE